MKNVFKRLVASLLICATTFGGMAFSSDLPVPTTSATEVDVREDSYFSGEYKEAHPVLAADVELSGFNFRNPDNALYLTSPTIPQDAINFAQQEFPRVGETLTAEELGFDPVIAHDLRISKGFIIKNVDGSSDDTYYFPVTYDGSVKGIMAIYQENGEYASLYGTLMISEALDNIRSMTSKMNPAVIYRTNDGLVAVTEDASQAETLIVFDVEDDSEIQIKASKAIESAIEAQRNVDDRDIYGNALVDSTQTYAAKPLLTDERNINADESKALPGRLQVQKGATCYAYVSAAVIQQFDATKHNDSSYHGCTPTKFHNWVQKNQKHSRPDDVVAGFRAFGWVVQKRGIVSYSNIKSRINAGYPYYLSLAGHAVECIGYRTLNEKQYKLVQDPWDGSSKTIRWTATSTKYKNPYRTNAETFTWSDTIG